MRKFLIPFMIILFTMNFVLSVYAGDFADNSLSQQQKQTYWERLNFIVLDTVNSFEDIHVPIRCFDVSDNHELLIAFDDCVIVITDDEYNILNVYSFDYEGSYYVFWNNGNIGLVLGRSDLIVEFSPGGSFINMTEASVTDNDTVKFWSGFETEHRLIVGDKSYFVKNSIDIINLLTGCYSQLVVVDEFEHEFVLFDRGLQNESVLPVAIGLFVVFVIFVIMKANQTNDGNRTGDGSMSCSEKS